MIFLRRPSPQSSVLFAWSLWCHCGQALYVHKLATITDSCALSFSTLLWVTKLLIVSKYIQDVYVRESYRIGNRILSRLYLHNCQRPAGRPSTVNLLLHSHLWLHIELPYFMLFTQLSLLLIMKISNRGKHEWTLHGQNNLWVISILVTGHWHKNLAQDMTVWGFTSTSSILDLPTCQRSSAERTWSSMQYFPYHSYVLWKTPVTG